MLGFSDERLIDAAVPQLRQLPYYHSFMGRTAAPTEALSAALARRLPAGIDHVFFGCSGSEAVETAIKLSRYYQRALGRPDKRLIIAREDAYHGSGSISAALTAMAYCHDGFDLPGDILRTGSPHHRRHARPGESERRFSARRAEELDELIRSVGPERVCAFIAEPAIGSGGAIPPPEGYWAEIQDVLADHDVLLIADEVITGFGRTGRWFGCETFGIAPDLMALAKQLSGAYVPISATAIHRDVHEVIASNVDRLGTLGHGFTYGGHPVAAAVALEAMAIYEELDLEVHVGRLADHLAARLAPLAELTSVWEVRQVGLMAGVELAVDGRPPGELGAAVGRRAEEHGVLLRVIGDTLAISPPLIVTEAELDTIVDVLHEAIHRVTGAPSCR